MIKVIKAGLATVIMITVGDYCSVTPGVLHRGKQGEWFYVLSMHYVWEYEVLL